jgi:hypothetical protein
MPNFCVLLRTFTQRKSVLWEVQRTVIFVAKRGNITYEGAAHRDIKFNIAVRCTFKTLMIYQFYKYCGALHLKFL